LIDSPDWHEDAECAKPENAEHVNKFFKTKTGDLDTKTVDRPEGGRWSTMKVVYCTKCKFVWQSRTSANAVEAFKAAESKKQPNDKS